ELGSTVAAVLYERHPFPARDRTVGQGERGEKNPVTRKFVVKPEAASGVPDLGYPSGMFDPPGFGWGGAITGPTALRHIHRTHRVARQDVLDVHEQQLLMLLLMVQAEGDQFGHSLFELPLQEAPHRLVDELPVAGHFID